MLFNKIGDLYDWWFYKSLYRSIVDVKSVFFWQQQTFIEWHYCHGLWARNEHGSYS